MKIGILTLPFGKNYGGMLQTYALQQALMKMGHECTTINLRPVHEKPTLTNKLKKNHLLRKLLGKRFAFDAKEEALIQQYTNLFIKQHIRTTSLVYAGETDKLGGYDYKAYIVGSDQVWRPNYTPNIRHYFFDFLKDKPEAIKIAYAASFGVDDWEFSAEDTKACAALAQKFNAISVREKSGIEQCRRYFGVDHVKQLLDPTLLLDKEDYIRLVKDETSESENNQLTAYILDPTEDKLKTVNRISSDLGLHTSEFILLPTPKNRPKSITPYILQPVTQWLHSFINARYVITDSFHGTVFAILFNKPFITIANKERGFSRFSSLLETFKLQDRLVHNEKEITPELIHAPIDFNQVNDILRQEREKAISFLRESLNQ